MAPTRRLMLAKNIAPKPLEPEILSVHVEQALRRLSALTRINEGEDLSNTLSRDEAWEVSSHARAEIERLVLLANAVLRDVQTLDGDGLA